MTISFSSALTKPYISATSVPRDLSTDLIHGVLRLDRLCGNLLRYGMNEGKDRYWGQFFGPIPEKLADI
jgi:hypothetical protein